MKFFSIVICLLLVLSTHPHQVIAASTEVDGFAGMAWGSSLQANQQTKNLILSKANDGKGGALYALKDVYMGFGEATLSSIECSFVENRLHGVMLLFTGEQNFHGVREEAKKRYGKPIFVSQKGRSMLTWPGKTSSIVLSYNLQSEAGFLYLKAKQLPPAAGIAAAPSPKAPEQPLSPAVPVDDLALFDQASGVQQVPAQPSDSTAPASEVANETAPIALISPEIQSSIDRDQALTRLCWDSLGAIADQACAEMQRNQQRLQELGWCVQPAQGGLTVNWVRCEKSSKDGVQTRQAQGLKAKTQQTASPKTSICSLVVELFAAAAELREKDVTPLKAEEALLRRQKERKKQLPIEQIRETVELVYFDHRYTSLPLLPLTAKVEQECRTGQGPYIAPLPLY